MHHHEESAPKRCCSSRRSHGCGKTIFLLGIITGGIYGMLFAKTSGDELRTKLKKSKTPILDFIQAGFETDMEFVKYVGKRISESCKDK